MTDPAITIENLSKRYRLGRAWAGANAPLRRLLRSARSLVSARRKPTGVDTLWALRDVDLRVRQGEVLGIIGPNGSGKSTLLKILSRITEPTTGCVRLRGRTASLLEVGTGFHPELTGRENIFLNGSVLGMTHAEIKNRFDDIVNFAGVDRFLDTPVKRYSSGMYVRLAFAVAAHLDPEILIVDEVLAVGDLAFQQKCLGKMRTIAGNGRTVLFVSHNMSAINAFCTRVVRLHQGRLVDDGDPETVMAAYLADTVVSSGARDFPADPFRLMQIRRVEIEGADRAQLIRRTDPLSIRLVVDVNELLSGAELVLSVERGDGTLVFETRDVDCAAHLSRRRRPGEYESRVSLPGGLLNAGTYTIRVLIERTAYDVLDRCDGIAFELHEPLGGAHDHTDGRARPGVLRLHLPWETRLLTNTTYEPRVSVGSA